MTGSERMNERIAAFDADPNKKRVADNDEFAGWTLNNSDAVIKLIPRSINLAVGFGADMSMSNGIVIEAWHYTAEPQDGSEPPVGIFALMLDKDDINDLFGAIFPVILNKDQMQQMQLILQAMTMEQMQSGQPTVAQDMAAKSYDNISEEISKEES